MPPRAILLLSGGLDSTLAGKLLQTLGIEVEALNFVSPFCQCTPASLGCPAGRRAAEQLGIPVRIISCGSDYLEVVKRPRFGRGRGMNPCLDCRIFMFSKARQYMAERGADFIATGEVLGERPMSQHRRAMALIEKESGLGGLIVRPLTARLLPASLAEQTGLVARDRLKAMHGRSRKAQFRMAEELEIRDFLCPAGGCLLTDAEFSARLRDLLDHDPDFGIADVTLLRVGRHFRLPGGSKVIVGRDREENEALEGVVRVGAVLLVPLGIPGPSVICLGDPARADVVLAGRLLAVHTKGQPTLSVEARSRDKHGSVEVVEHVVPLEAELVATWRVAARPVPSRRDAVR